MATVISFPTTYRPTPEYIDIVEVARMIRPELKQHFPGVKFSVRTDRYSMGCSVNVSWTDGPTTRQVDAVIGHFSGKTFDGSDDSTHYHATEHNGRRVQFPNFAPHTSREVTGFKALEAQALEMIRTRCGLDETGKRYGNDWIDNLASNMVWACDFREANPLERAFRVAVLREND